MSVAESPLTRDPLAKLRIDRSEGRRRPSWARRFVTLVVVAGVLGGAGYFAWLRFGSQLGFRPEVKVGTVVRESGASADAVLAATGYLKSRRQAKIGARAAGRIQEINFEEGDVVKTGQVIAVLEHADIDAMLAAAKANLTRAQAELRESEAQRDQDQREFDRTDRLRRREGASDIEWERAELRLTTSKRRCESLDAAIRSAEARIREIEQQLENMHIRAPFDGTVISKDAELGESILPGGMGEASGRGSVATLADLAHLEVDTDVKEDYISRISEAQPAEVAVDAVPNRRYRGRLRKIIPMGDRARATIKVKVEVLDADKRLFPDMSATVYFMPRDAAERAEPATSIVLAPSNALRSDGQGNYVWRVVDERLQRVRVELGDRREARVVVKQGLSGGESVVVDPSADLTEGMAVRIAP